MCVRNKIGQLILVAALFFVLAEMGFATNFGFLPGDSCFHTTLCAKDLERILEEDSPVFDYIRAKSASRLFCGYGGFYKLQYPEMPNEFKQNLKKTYDQIRKGRPTLEKVFAEVVWDDNGNEVETGKIIREELNPIHVFFVNADFDLKRFKIGLKYNESWVEEKQAFAKHRLEDVELDLFVETGEAVVQDWRDSKLVARLNVKSPESSIKLIDKPVVVTGKLKAIVLPSAEIEKCFHGDLEYYVVDEEKIEIHESNSGAAEEIPAEAGSQGGANSGGLFIP